ncbi:MAG: discoidin domain-containing protein [Polyangiaceae bacterium]
MKNRFSSHRSTAAARASLLLLGIALADCATYEGTPPDVSNDDAAGASGGSGVAGMNSAGSDNSSGAAGASAGSGNAGDGSAGKGGSAASGSGGSGSGGASAGSAGKGGGASAGSAGKGGGASAGSGGASAGSGGSGTVVDTLLSRGKPVSADSVQLGHLAADGNDASLTTRWCAADAATGHNWQVDLGQLRTLGKLQIAWEKAENYRFKVDGSADGQVWKLLLDQTATTSTAATQMYPLAQAPQARWVRITITAVPTNIIAWASFFDFSVFGH